MKVYAIKWYIAYEMDDVKELYFKLKDAKNILKEKYSGDNYRLSKDGMVAGDNNWKYYIQEYEVK